MDLEPPIPARSHRHAQRRSIKGGIGIGAASSSSSAAAPSSSFSSPAVPPANPEVISNLISSLSVISQPAESHFQSLPAAPSLSPNRSPTRSSTDKKSTSYGIDYAAYSSYLADDRATPRDHSSLDEIPATSPVVRTSKLPPGYSTRSSGAAHPASPRSPRSPSRDSARGISKSLNRSANTSRPSSPGSIGSRNDDAGSIGNLSIERGSAPNAELRPRRSHDSWGKKTGRSHKNLMYMSSKERLRDRDQDRKRAPGTTMPVAASTGSISSIHSISRGDPFLAEMPISEEPSSSNDVFSSPQPVPTRESSLRKSGHKKRSSGRRSVREIRDTDGSLASAIPEGQEYNRNGATSRSSHKRGESDTGKSFLFDVDEYAAVTKALDDEYARENNLPTGPTGPRHRSYAEQLDDEGAPSPSIANGRRQYERNEERNGRLSGRLSPSPAANEPSFGRSNSRMKKRLSVPMAPRSERSSEHSDRPNHLAGYERPVSADSVDDAVESYLCSPRLSQKIRHPQSGRTISFSEVGDPEGSAVFCCVGMGLTRYITAFYDELALTLKLRLITPDRPGVGDSEPYLDGTTTPLSWPDDVYAICQALKITKFSILAHSAGAIYALATALRMPQHIRGKIHLLAPWIPPSQMNVFGGTQAMPPTNAIPTSQRILRALPTPLLKAANSSFMSATSASLTSSLPKNTRRPRRKSSGRESRSVTPGGALDREDGELQQLRDGDESQPPMKTPDATENMDSMHLPQGTMYTEGNTIPHALADKERQLTYDMRLTHAIWDLATTGANPAVDLLVCLERQHSIGFRYVDITRPVVLHHGSKDNRVPVDNVKWLGKSMRRCEVRVLEGEGHGLMASASVMGSVLMEMSKEWEDWMRVTGADGRKERERGRRSGR